MQTAWRHRHKCFLFWEFTLTHSPLTPDGRLCNFAHYAKPQSRGQTQVLQNLQPKLTCPALPAQPTIVAGYAFLSDGWWPLVRPSSSHLTTASSSLACSTVPNSPVGFPKFPKPSTRSPGFTSGLVADSASDGFFARSASGVAPRYARGGCGALRSSGIGFSVVWAIFRFLFPRPE